MGSIKKNLFFIFFPLFLVSCSPFWSGESGHKPKYIFILIADGCGYELIDAASYYSGEQQSYEFWDVQLGMSTFPAGGSYSPDLAWSEFDYVSTGATDSAAAATAMSTGFKTGIGAIGRSDNTAALAADGRLDLTHLMSVAEVNGYSTGVVTSVPFSHATPAGFVAHSYSRTLYETIAVEMLNSRTDVIIGAGHPEFDDDGLARIPAAADGHFRYVGGEAVWDSIVDPSDGFYDHWTLLEEKEDFEALASGSGAVPFRLLGVVQTAQTLQYKRTGVSGLVNPGGDTVGDPFVATVPDLSTLALCAIQVLRQNDNGFVLMVEGGAGDWAGHDNDAVRMIEEERSFNDMTRTVIEWVETNSDWDESLVIITGDHETGYLTGTAPDMSSSGPWVSVADNGAGVLPGMEFHLSGHTNNLIPFFARGYGAWMFRNEIIGTDPVRGDYIDNTAIGQVVKNLLDN